MVEILKSLKNLLVSYISGVEADPFNVSNYTVRHL